MEEGGVFPADPVVQRRQVGQVIDNGIADRRDNDEARTGYQDEQPEPGGHTHVDLAKTLDAFVQTGDDRNQRNRDDDKNQDDLGRISGFDAEQVVQAAGDLSGAQAQ